MQLRILAILLILFSRIGSAGDLSDLPTTQQAFKDKILLFIPLGNALSESIKLLEIHAFRCSDLTGFGHMFHCIKNRGGAMGSKETIHEVWLEYDTDQRIIDVITGVTELPGIDEMLIK